MSERYGVCTLCRGQGVILNVSRAIDYVEDACPRCNGSGDSGDSIEFLRKELNLDKEQDGYGN